MPNYRDTSLFALLKLFYDHQRTLSCPSKFCSNVSDLRKPTLVLLGRVRPAFPPAVSCTFYTFCTLKISGEILFPRRHMAMSGISWVLTSGSRGLLATAIQSLEANNAAGHSTRQLPPFLFGSKYHLF